MRTKKTIKRGKKLDKKLQDSPHKSFVSMFILSTGIFLSITIVSALLVPLPSINNFRNRQVAESTKIYDRTVKILLYDIHGSMRRTEVSIGDISQNMLNATIAIEDKNFYQHHGFNLSSIVRAFKANLFSGNFTQGGSTITQQVVKNTLLSNKKTIPRKIKEIVLAIRLEGKYSKDEILNTYLNEMPYGGVIYGVEEASQYFFGKNASDLSIAESAYLASLPKGPTYYSPYGPNRDLLEERKNMVLDEMKNEKLINEEEYNLALEEVVEFVDKRTIGIKAPHFVFFVKQALVEKYGEEMVENGGLKVITTLDWNLQKKSEEILTKKALENSKKLNASNAGLVALDPNTGQILAMVGSRGYFDEKIDGKVNIALAERQPGSAFKPFVYATVFKKGYSPETVVFDLKTQFSTSCSPNNFTSEDRCYSPTNFGDKIHGPITLRNALAQSVNIASVKALYLAGISESIDTARDMGIETLTDKSRYGLSLVLGGGEVTLLQMTSAYGVFADEGVRNPETSILEVTDNKGEVLEKYTPSPKIVLDTEIARTISNILSDNIARAPEFGYNSPLYFPNMDVAVKTGTTNDYRDAWIIGYNNSIVIGVWAGNNDNTPMIQRIAEFSAAPLWHEVMAYAMTKYPASFFTKPEVNENMASLPPVLRGDWNSNPALGVHDILFWIDKDNPREGLLYGGKNDPQLALWEYPVSLWANQNINTGTTTDPILEQIQSSGEITATYQQ